jgi:hemolysin activation/secretion protein
MARGPFRRLESGAAIVRRSHPFYDVSDVRERVSAMAETVTRRAMRADVSAGWERVRFGGTIDRLARVGAGVTVDTRVDPVLARNAVLARASWERLSPRTGAFDILDIDVSGFLGFVGRSVLVAHGRRRDANRALPPYEQAMIGGAASVRGVAAGSAVGDTLTAGSLELRVPLTSPIRFGRAGISVFADAATVYDEGARLRDQRFERGVGAGLWFSAAFARVGVAVARGIGHGTRLHLTTNLTF